MVSYSPWSNSGFKGVKTAAEKGWNRFSEKIAKNANDETTKRDLEVVDGVESKNVTNEKCLEFFFHI